MVVKDFPSRGGTPTARRAAILSCGKPMAFEASAEERLTEGSSRCTTTIAIGGVMIANWECWLLPAMG